MSSEHEAGSCVFAVLSGGGSHSGGGISEFIIGEMSQLYLWLGLGILWEKVMASNCLDWRKVEAPG